MSKAPDSHFRTEHLLTNLGQRAVSGGFITALAQGMKFILNLASAVVLARLLSPHDFGLVAMAGALMPILRTFREGGLSTATVQKEGITHAQVSNLFWINLALGGLITLIGVALAPVISWFYKDERLLVVTILLSMSFVLSGAAVQHLALLNRQMRFKAVALIDIISATFGFLVGFVLACTGFGYWSLVGMQLSVTLGEVVLTWMASGWLPQLPRRGSGTKPLLQFGASMTVYILLRRLAGSIDVILLGRIYGASAVGLYTRATVLLLRPLDQFITPFDTVFIPILSRLQNQPERYRHIFLQVYGAIALLSFGFAGLLLGLSEPLVLLLLGPQWIAVVPIFFWLTIAALYIPLSYAAMWLLTTQGRSRDLMTIGVFVTLLTVISVAVGLPFGTTGLAMAFSLMGLFIRLPVHYHLIGKTGPVSRSDLWGVFFRHLPLWVVVGASTWLVQRATASYHPLTQVAMAGFVGTVVGGIVVFSLGRLRSEVIFIIEQGKKFIESRKAPHP